MGMAETMRRALGDPEKWSLRERASGAEFEADQHATEVLRLRRENQRLREAIADALTDLRPGFAPYGLLRDALDKERES